MYEQVSTCDAARVGSAISYSSILWYFITFVYYIMSYTIIYDHAVLHYIR